MTDPIADMLSRIRNASRVHKERVSMPSSRMKQEIARVLKEEGYILDYSVVPGVPAELTLVLNYTQDRIPAIQTLQRVSKPGCRIYAKTDKIPVILQNMGVAILSTSKGVMTNRQARRSKLGGEVLCSVS